MVGLRLVSCIWHGTKRTRGVVEVSLLLYHVLCAYSCLNSSICIHIYNYIYIIIYIYILIHTHTNTHISSNIIKYLCANPTCDTAYWCNQLMWIWATFPRVEASLPHRLHDFGNILWHASSSPFWILELQNMGKDQVHLAILASAPQEDMLAASDLSQPPSLHWEKALDPFPNLWEVWYWAHDIGGNKPPCNRMAKQPQETLTWRQPTINKYNSLFSWRCLRQRSLPIATLPAPKWKWIAFPRCMAHSLPPNLKPFWVSYGALCKPTCMGLPEHRIPTKIDGNPSIFPIETAILIHFIIPGFQTDLFFLSTVATTQHNIVWILGPQVCLR